MNVLVTGGAGQLAQCLKSTCGSLSDAKFIFADIEELDITDFESVDIFFKAHQLDFCVNCAAYTLVDKAEFDSYLSKKVNELAPMYLAKACLNYNVKLVHISTDYVFDGKSFMPYNERDATNPLNVYGRTKLNGENEIVKLLNNYWIIRTSWLYSEYGNNFLKTMLRLGSERQELSIVCDQIGTPTYAVDLAEVILKIISSNSNEYGLYLYSNEGEASWFDFAKSIFEEANISCRVHPINTEGYPTPARRPMYSVMDKRKIKKSLKIEIPFWKQSLKKCLNNINN